MSIHELRDRFHAEWKRCEDDYDAAKAESATISHTVCRVDITATILKEKSDECEILRVRFEHFDRLAKAAE